MRPTTSDATVPARSSTDTSTEVRPRCDDRCGTVLSRTTPHRGQEIVSLTTLLQPDLAAFDLRCTAPTNS
jgi:hypothetical protein